MQYYVYIYGYTYIYKYTANSTNLDEHIAYVSSPPLALPPWLRPSAIAGRCGEIVESVVPSPAGEPPPPWETVGGEMFLGCPFFLWI